MPLIHRRLCRVKPQANSWFVSTTGSSGNLGTISSPWDIVTGLSSSQVKPGDTVYFRGGVYQYLPRNNHYQDQWKISLQGEQQAPIWVKPYNNEHVELDGGLGSQNSPNQPRHVYIKDFEFYISENIGDSRFVAASGSDSYQLLGRLWGGIDMARGVNLKLINCVIHDCAQGIGWWSEIVGAEIYGCIIYNNGWDALDRKHGHGLYTQNESQVFTHGQWKYYNNNMFIDNWVYGIHAFGSGAARFNFARFEKNMCIGKGNTDQGGWLLGLSSPTMHYIEFINNFGGDNNKNKWRGRGSFGYIASVPIQYGIIKDNVSAALIEVFPNSTKLSGDNNWIWHGGTPSFPNSYWGTPRIYSISGYETPSWVFQNTSVPTEPITRFWINKYDPNRAHVGILCAQGETSVPIDPSQLLTSGDYYHIYAPTGLWQEPLVRGTYVGDPINFPMAGTSSGNNEFGLKATELDSFILQKLDHSEWFVATDGSSGNLGTMESPWDISTGLTSTQIQPGDTLYLRGGIYQYSPRTAGEGRWSVSLQGASGQSIWIKPYSNEHVELDGGLKAHDSIYPRYVNIMGLEIYVSENIGDSRVTSTPGGNGYGELNRIDGGIDFTDGYALKIINCHIHANRQGIGWWGRLSGNCELYGNVIFDNGWNEPDRNHGHGIYSQNETEVVSHGDWKYYIHNILIDNWSLNCQIYGSDVARTNYIHYEANMWTIETDSDDGRSLIGGSAKSFHKKVFDNFAFGANPGHYRGSLQIGFKETDVGDDLIVYNNYCGDFDRKQEYTNVVESGNTNYGTGGLTPPFGFSRVRELSPSGEPYPTYTERDWRTTPLIKTFYNKYDNSRLHVGILCTQGETSAAVNPGYFLNQGDYYELKDPQNFWGSPLLSGVYSSGTISVPMSGISDQTDRAVEFRIYILTK